MSDIHHSQQPASLTPEELCARAMDYQLAGHLDLAEQLYREILRAQPKHSRANHCFGLLYVQLQQPEAGLPHLLAALEAAPETADYWLGYIEALILSGQTDAAQQVLILGQQHGLEGAAFESLAARLKESLPKTPIKKPPKSSPKHPKPADSASRGKARPTPQAENALMALIKQWRFDEAAAQARAMTERFPQHGFGWKVLGAMSRSLGRITDALAAMQKSVDLMPQDAEAQQNFGVFLSELGKLDEAEAFCRRALAINPDYATAHDSLGAILIQQERHAEAETCYRAALSLQPDHANAEGGLGLALALQGETDLALPHFRRALGLSPNRAELVYSNMLYTLSHSATLDAASLFAEHCGYGEQFEARYRDSWPRHPNPRDPDRCLQVGFVSGDFNSHALANFIEPILAQLQPEKFPTLELHAYYNNFLEDEVTKRLRGYLPHWHSVSSLSDAALAQMILDDKIDILIDLSGHTGRSRLLLFARKPAPVQVSWMGYPGTTGLSAMDYYLSDRHFTPPGQFDDQFTEKLVYLPAAAPFLPFQGAPPVNDLPALKTGYLTFGSFNRLNKINASTIALWAKLLRALPDSQMLLAGISQEAKLDNLIEWFTQEGITRERLSFHPRCGMEHYLNLHHQVDICLDTFPYNGGTTTLHALWMGVPTLTLVGNSVVGRSGITILGHAGLEAFAAKDAEDFVRKGIYWAGNLAALSDIRAGLRERFAKSAPGQPAVVAAGVERALRIMWQRWCAGLPPESFEVSLQDIDVIKQEASK